jgi:hypothetical protein
MIGDGKQEITLNKNVGLIHIKEDAPKNNQADISLKQAEDLIGVRFLHSKMYSIDALQYMPIIPHNEIEKVILWYAGCVMYGKDTIEKYKSGDFTGKDEKYISGDFTLLTDKATEHVIPDQDTDATGGKVLLHSYKSGNLNTNVIIYGADWSKARITAVFDYKDIHYSFTGNNVTQKEMMEFIKTLK